MTSWDPAKAEANLRKHGIDFADAEGCFYDQNMLTLPDKDHPDRMVAIAEDFTGTTTLHRLRGCSGRFRETHLRKNGLLQAQTAIQGSTEMTNPEDYDFTNAQQGPRRRTDAGKSRITIRLDNEVLEFFSAARLMVDSGTTRHSSTKC